MGSKYSKGNSTLQTIYSNGNIRIIPQAICTRYGLAIGATLYWLVWGLIGCFFVVSYPVSKLLDCLLGHDSGTRYRRAELKELIGIQAADDESERLTQGNSIDFRMICDRC